MLLKNLQAKYLRGDAMLEFARYGSQRLALRLNDPDEGFPLCTASVNIPEAKLADGEIILKGWSENEGIPDALVLAGVVSPALRFISTGLVVASVHRLLVSPPQEG